MSAERATARPAAVGAGAVSTVSNWGYRLQRLPLHIVIIIFCVMWVVPTLGLIINSFRSVSDMASAGWWTVLFPPHGFTLASYQQVLAIEGVGSSIISSVLITIPATVIQLTIATMGAYAFAWMKFPGKDIFFIVIVGLMVVPIQMTLIPVLQLFKVLHLNGTIQAVWLAHSGYGLPFEVFLLRNYLGGLPREIFESAEMDGAGHSVRFLRIAVPMTVPAIASLTIFVFLGIWNDLLVALTFLGTSHYRPFTVVITGLVTSLGGGWQFLTAAAVLQMSLPLLVFIFLQRYFVRGITSGSVKG
ncbi:MAG TPA: carbohydrate ABC transporter permease [Candidatus Dormibacteraeota bacterium]|nr:carbohydrate ABC transporter permease [Candidatus Dormibacteraeota bacterium]